MLVLEDIDVARGTREVLRQVSLAAASPGALFVVGGGGAGKSSLLGAIAARGDALLLGTATWHGRPLAASPPAIAWLGQRDRFEDDVPMASPTLRAWLQAARVVASPAAWPHAVLRYLAVMYALSVPADLYLLDEPTAGLAGDMADVVRERMKAAAARACLMVATHDRRDGLHVGGSTVLLAGETVQESAPTSQFFRQPRTEAGRIYVDTGNCSMPAAPRRPRFRPRLDACAAAPARPHPSSPLTRGT